MTIKNDTTFTVELTPNNIGNKKSVSLKQGNDIVTHKKDMEDLTRKSKPVYKMLEKRKPFYEVEQGTSVLTLISKIPSSNKTGVKGVSFDNRVGKYIAQMVFKGKRVLYKHFDTLDEAEECRREYEKLYFQPVIDKAKEKGLLT